MKPTWVIAAVIIVISLQQSSAQGGKDTSSGNYMLPHCKHFASDNYSYDVWDGDCGGVISALLFFGRAFATPNKICAPSGVTQGQAARIIINYLERNPEILHLDFKGLAHSALQKAWPCQKGPLPQ